MSRPRIGVVWTSQPCPSWQVECVDEVIQSIDADVVWQTDISTFSLDQVTPKDEIKKPLGKIDCLQLGSVGLDAIIAFCPPGPSFIESVAPYARFGVWWPCFGLPQLNSPTKVVQDAILRGMTVTDGCLMCLRSDATGTREMVRWRISVRDQSVEKTVRSLVATTAMAVAKVWRQSIRGDEDRDEKNVRHPFGEFGTETSFTLTTSQRLKLGLRQVVSRSRAILFGQHWSIGVIDEPIESLLASETPVCIQWLKNPRWGEFLADPFAFSCRGEIHILAEAYNHWQAKGRIVRLRLQSGHSLEALGTVIGRPTHMSYPYLFEADGELWCVPETSREQRVVLYRYVPDGDEFVFSKPLIEGVSLADCTVHRHEGRWWLFGIRPGGVALDIWHATTLMGEWLPHYQNPVKIDACSARPGGTPFYHQGNLYRPAQDNSQRYGGALVIQKIDVLTPEMFRETEVRRLEPRPEGSCPHGLHTLSGAGGRTLVDGSRERFIPIAILGKIVRRLQRLCAG